MLLATPRAPRLTTVLFDLDDTLFDHTATSRAALWATTCELPFFAAADFELFYQHYSGLLEELHLRVLAGTCSYAEARRLRFEGLLARYQPTATAAAAERLADAYYVQYPRQRQPVPGALALLQALRPHYRIGIITNNRTAEQADKLRFLGMTDLVDALVTSEDVGVAKPDPRIFHVALQQLDARSEETVLVGDNWVADVLGALAVGIRPLWLNRAGAPRPLAEVAEITSLEPLAEVLTKIAGAPASQLVPAE
jgi:HAD superfamily hydrolase (TIGR01549 family)